MRKGFDGLALLVQETLKRNPHNGNLFVFRGRRGSLVACRFFRTFDQATASVCGTCG
jgi:transposase